MRLGWGGKEKPHFVHSLWRFQHAAKVNRNLMKCETLVEKREGVARGRGIFNRSNALLSALYSCHTFITQVSLLFHSFYRFFAHKHATLQMRMKNLFFIFSPQNYAAKKTLAATQQVSLIIHVIWICEEKKFCWFQDEE